MDTNVPLDIGRFVVFRPEEGVPRERLALVLGVMGMEEEFIVLYILTLHHQSEATCIAPRAQCEPVSATDVHAGLIGFLAHLPHFGVGTVIYEEERDGVLHAILENEDGRSPLVPITVLRFTGLYTR